MLLLTDFAPIFPFHIPWKHQKTFGFLVFSGDMIWERGVKWVNLILSCKIFEAPDMPIAIASSSTKYFSSHIS